VPGWQAGCILYFHMNLPIQVESVGWKFGRLQTLSCCRLSGKSIELFLIRNTRDLVSEYIQDLPKSCRLRDVRGHILCPHL